jgi:hypothetical protein
VLTPSPAENEEGAAACAVANKLPITAVKIIFFMIIPINFITGNV